MTLTQYDFCVKAVFKCENREAYVAAAGISVQKMAFRFAVPMRTMGRWPGEGVGAHLHTRLMMQDFGPA